MNEILVEPVIQGMCLKGKKKCSYTLWKWSEVAQSCPTLCDPVDCSPPGSSVHGILQARILEWVAISFSRGSFWPTDRTQISHIAGRHFNLWATREARTLKRCRIIKEIRHTFRKQTHSTRFGPRVMGVQRWGQRWPFQRTLSHTGLLKDV